MLCISLQRDKVKKNIGAGIYIVTFFFINSFLLQVKHTHRKEKKLHRINKVIRREKNIEFTHLHGNSYKY